MTDQRMVAMTAEQYAEVELCIEALMRMNKNERASTLMNLALAYKFAKAQETERSPNVIDLHDFSRRVSTPKEVPA